MRVLVADASAIVEYLFRTEAGTVIGPLLASSENDVHVPALCDVEVLDAIRRQVLLGRADRSHALEMLDAYRDLPLTRHGHGDLLAPALELRHNFTAYDATYVALAELLEATLVTSDHSLVRAAVDHTLVSVEEV